MGFLKFLKREKKEALDELDLPPAPPPLEGFEEVPEFPEFPEFPEISAEPKFEFPEPESTSEEKIPEFPSFPELEEKPPEPIAPLSAPIRAHPIPETMPTSQPIELEQPTEEETGFDTTETYPKIAGRLFAKEKRLLHERPTGKIIYVRVDKFKATLGSINMARSDLRKSEEALARLENIKNAKDRAFDKVKTSLDDLQGKFIFIDKTLFKGE